MKQLFNTARNDILTFHVNESMGINPTTNKPNIAMWTSTAKKTENGWTSDWLEWCEENDFDIEPNNFLITPKDDIKVHIIDSYEDLLNTKITDVAVSWFDKPCIDFGWYIRNGYHGIHLTEKGAIECWGLYSHEFENGRIKSVPRSIHLNAWDVESTCWFNSDWIKGYAKV